MELQTKQSCLAEQMAARMKEEIAEGNFCFYPEEYLEPKRIPTLIASL